MRCRGCSPAQRHRSDACRPPSACRACVQEHERIPNHVPVPRKPDTGPPASRLPPRDGAYSPSKAESQDEVRDEVRLPLPVS